MSNKLTQHKVNSIRHQVNVLNETNRVVATRYKVSPSTVSAIANYKTYRDIPAPTAVPGFPNYLIYSDGRIWSNAGRKFIKKTSKRSGGKKEYVQLKNSGIRRSVKISSLIKSVFS